MRLRDLLVLAGCAVAILASLRQDGDLELRASWHHEIDLRRSSYRNGVAPGMGECVPRPIITDVEGDGFNEILLVTRDPPELKLLHLGDAPPSASKKGRRRDPLVTEASEAAVDASASGSAADRPRLDVDIEGDWNVLSVHATASLMSEGVPLRSGRQAIALASGYIHQYSNKRARSQIIVVVTEGWNILCFDSSLQLLWERSVDAELSDAYVDEVAVLITPHGMLVNDTGSVIVGGRLRSRVEAVATSPTAYGVHREGEEARRKQLFADEFVKEDGIDELMERNEAVEEAEHSGIEFETPLREHEKTFFGTEHEHHFSFYAFDGLTGDRRWEHEKDDFVSESAPSDLLRPQHDVHTGEMDWRTFRRSLIAHLPHVWASRDDTHFELAHLEKEHHGRSRRVGEAVNIQEKKKLRKQSNEASMYGKGDRREGVVDGDRNVQPEVPTWTVRPGGTRGRGGPARGGLSSSSSGHDIVGLRWLLPHDDSEHVPHPNAFIAHLRGGIEAIHLYSGRTLCRMSLEAGALSADVNVDGVIDHINVVTGSHSPYISQVLDPSSLLPRCLAVAKSGTPPIHPFWNTSVCERRKHDLFGALTQHGEKLSASADGLRHRRRSGRLMDVDGGVGGGIPGREQVADGNTASLLFVAPPTTVPVHDKDRNLGFGTVFFTSSGVVTFVSPDGQQKWRSESGVKWLGGSSLLHDDAVGLDADADAAAAGTVLRGEQQRAFPNGAVHERAMLKKAAFTASVSSTCMYRDGPVDHLVVVGEEEVALLGAGSGTIRAHAHLHGLPVARPVIGDFSNDGVYDVILVTTDGYYGFRVKQKVYGKLFTIIVGAVVAALGVAMVVRVSNGALLTTGGGSPRTYRAQQHAARYSHGGYSAYAEAM